MGRRHLLGIFLLSAASLLLELALTPTATAAGPDAQAPDDATAEEPPRKPEPAREGTSLEQVVVTGSRLPTAAGKQVLPVRTYTREEIQRSGQGTIAGFLNDLPSVSTRSNSNARENISYDGTPPQTVSLHGLGAGGITAILIDGHRTDGDFYNNFDLGNIPLAAVERIEILTVGASTIYGSDAMAGAVNIITRKDFEGGEASASHTFIAGSHEDGASLTWGKGFGRGSVMVLGTVSEIGNLLGSARPYGRILDQPGVGDTYLGTVTDACAPGTVYSLDGNPLPGLAGTHAAIPAGIDPTQAPTIADFAAGDGQAHKCNSAAGEDIINWQRRFGLTLTGRYQLRDWAEVYGQVLASRSTVRTRYGYISGYGNPEVGGGTVLAAGNPYNPFGVDVGVSFNNAFIVVAREGRQSLLQPAFGLRGLLPFGWHYDVSAHGSISRDTSDNPQVDNFLSDRLAATDPAIAFNPFTSGVPGTDAAYQDLRNAVLATDTGASRSRIMGGRVFVNGTVARLPTGPIEAGVGAELERRDLYLDIPHLGYGRDFNVGRHSFAPYGEARVPLLGRKDAAGQQVAALSLSLGGRYDRASDYYNWGRDSTLVDPGYEVKDYGKFTWQAGLRWEATSELALTAGYGLSFHAPNPQDMYYPAQFSPDNNFGQDLLDTRRQVPDPANPGQLLHPEVNGIAIGFVGNPYAKPENGRSTTLGIEYSPAALPNFNAKLSWYHLAFTDPIVVLVDFNTIIRYEAQLPGLVLRDPPSAADIAAGQPGPINRINFTITNMGEEYNSGVDLDLRYRFKTGLGDWTASASVSNIHEFAGIVIPGVSPRVDTVGKSGGVFGSFGWAPRWKGTLALWWQRARWSASLSGKYVGSYDDNENWNPAPPRHSLGNSWIFDGSARYEVGQAHAGRHPWLAGTYAAVNVANLLGTPPPNAYTGYGFDFSQYDLRGRTVQVRLGANW